MSEIIKKLTKSEFSKKLTVWILIIYAVIVFVMISLMAFVNFELGGNFIGILGVITAIPTTCVGFYFYKAKAENLLKIGNSTETSTENSTDIQG